MWDGAGWRGKCECSPSGESPASSNGYEESPRTALAVAKLGLWLGVVGVISRPGAVAAQDSAREPHTMCRDHRSIVCRSFEIASGWVKHDIRPIDHQWAIEIKMFRPNGDNGKPDDRSHRTSAAAPNSCAASLSLRRVSWSIVGRGTAGAGDAPSPSETDEVTNVGA